MVFTGSGAAPASRAAARSDARVAFIRLPSLEEARDRHTLPTLSTAPAAPLQPGATAAVAFRPPPTVKSACLAQLPTSPRANRQASPSAFNEPLLDDHPAAIIGGEGHPSPNRAGPAAWRA